jgi:UDP-N-acetylmuramate dehydrogenase
MLKIQSDFPLYRSNTFGIHALAEFYTDIHTNEDLVELADSDIFDRTDHLILGGGSNILFTRNYRGLIIHPAISSFEITDDDNRYASVRVGSGVVWDSLVEWAITKNLGGIENLSGIPGTVGASPIQNIGAYGTEVKDAISHVEGFDLKEKDFRTFTADACKFGYRTSLFKESMKNRFVVCYVTFRLTKPPHKLVTHYGTIEEELKKYPQITIATVRKAVLAIRNSKLPDPMKIGNAGSFFKNPVVKNDLANDIKKTHPAAPVYPAGNDRSKLSAAWLIDQAGCKGLRIGNAATHLNQPLVLVNLGGATGKEILELAAYVKNKVAEMFDIQLEEEVNIV